MQVSGTNKPLCWSTLYVLLFPRQIVQEFPRYNKMYWSTNWMYHKWIPLCRFTFCYRSEGLFVTNLGNRASQTWWKRLGTQNSVSCLMCMENYGDLLENYLWSSAGRKSETALKDFLKNFMYCILVHIRFLLVWQWIFSPYILILKSYLVRTQVHSSCRLR